MSERDALGLTPRQAQVLRLVVQGKCEKRICQDTGLARGTIKIHTRYALRAIGARSRTEAIVRVAALAGIDLVASLDRLREIEVCHE